MPEPTAPEVMKTDAVIERLKKENVALRALVNLIQAERDTAISWMTKMGTGLIKTTDVDAELKKI